MPTTPPSSPSSKPLTSPAQDKGNSVGRPKRHFVMPPRLDKPAQPKPKRRLPKWRYILWAFEFVILVACLEHFILRPHRARKQLASKAIVSQAPAGEIIRPLAERARVLPGLQEVFPAYLAPLSGLADGSEAMRAAQLSTSEATGLPVEAQNSIGMLFRLVPAGSCLIGSPPNEAGRGNIEIQHEVNFPEPFYLGKFEVTQSQWCEIMGYDNNPSSFRGADRPVEEISWYDCQRFTHLLCQREQLPQGTYRLPTEAEWEYACRAGTTTAYCFGNNPKNLKLWADYADNNYRGTVNVGRRRPNALGLYDMHGNVWEWCLDDYHNYPGDDSPTAEHHQYLNLRGGNWYVEATECRSANRARLPAASTGNMLGFRVLRMIAEPPPVRRPWEPKNNMKIDTE